MPCFMPSRGPNRPVFTTVFLLYYHVYSVSYSIYAGELLRKEEVFGCLSPLKVGNLCRWLPDSGLWVMGGLLLRV